MAYRYTSGYTSRSAKRKSHFSWHLSKKPSTVVETDPAFRAALRNPEQRIIYFIHGGGYVVCSTQTHRGVVYNLVDKTGFMLFTPNYRRPPDVDLLVSVDDCVQGYFHLTDTLKIAPNRITLMGDSAGTNLCMQVGGAGWTNFYTK